MTVAPLEHRELGLSDDEWDAIRARLGREPSRAELAMFSVMWSEHCSYKSSRVHLRHLPTEGPHVVVGPGEGAGVVEVAPGVAVAWKLESHNHPSFVEPFNGAATGVGGIVRDILSMGGRPIALMDSLRFGSFDDRRTGYLLEGVVSGISSYGNAIGVPTVGGELVFADSYSDNPLVNVACLGVVEDRLMQARADSVGHRLVLFGSATGRDGIGGASVLASAEFDESAAAKRPAVQVGDPLAEKLLIEASLEMVRRGAIEALQDLGAGGICCPVSEMTAKSGTGARLEADEVHVRETDMEPFEVLISESQERMLATVAADKVPEVLAICRRWEIEARAIGEVTASGSVEVVSGGEVVADVPALALAEEGPVYDRPRARPEWLGPLQASPPGDEAPVDLEVALLELLGAPGVASKRWVWEQYDHMILLGTLEGPGGDAAVIRLPNSEVAVALSTDGPGRLCYLDPYEGTRLAVAEGARNVACVGARPLAVTNCLNLGNPERPEVMWQFAEVVRGLGDACRALETPVTGGNVSFYNETSHRAIYPTPVIGMLGVLDSPRHRVGSGFVAEGYSLVLVGATDPSAFGGSEYAEVINGTVAGLPPRLDLAAEASLHRFLQEVATSSLAASAHDLSSGGLAVCLAESAIRSGLGVVVEPPPGDPHRMLFSESPSRAVVSCRPEVLEEVRAVAASVRLPTYVLGNVGGDDLDLGAVSVSLKAASLAYENGLPSHLSNTVN